MFCNVILARKASLILHYYLHRCTHSRKAFLSTLDKLPQTGPDASSLCAPCGVNQHRSKHPVTPPELSLATVSYQRPQIRCYGQAEDSSQSLSKDAPLSPGKPHSLSAKVSVLKPRRSQKCESQKQKLGSHGDVKEDKCHSVYLRDSSTKETISVSKAGHNGSVKLFGINLGVCKDGDVSTFESTERREFSAKVEPSRDSEGTTCSLSHHGVVTRYDSAVLSTTEWGGKLPDSDGASMPLQTLDSVDSSMPLQTLEDACQTELLRKVRLVEGLSPSDAARLFKRRAFKRCSLEQLETVIQVLEEYLLSSERVFKVLEMNSGVLLHSVDLLQKKLQVFADFQIEKEVAGRVCMWVNVLNTSVESLQEKLAFLEDLGLNVEAKNKLLCRGPCVLGFTIQNFKKTIDFLSGIGATKEGIMRLVQSCPQLLSVSCDTNLIPRYHFFQQIGIPAVNLPRAACFATRTSMNTLKEHMRSLEDVGFSHDEVCSMVRKEPDLLRSCNIQRIKRILDYLLYEQKYNMADIVKYPKGLSISLERRIIPRCRLIEEHGLFKVYSLSTIMGCSDSRLRKKLLHSN